ncbi:sigma factor [Paenibacillus kribbensis]|uniref:sigma-70 family RNA polymerase sigma factor n=1 Tax=Paenibacillus kribbensis TaxID=172713 RepID=UPI002DBA13A3|nr:sigma factor [Paenibacillus kribbensis]MEC0233563.1 sigma factor [Paenibacillus kribbensis]
MIALTAEEDGRAEDRRKLSPDYNPHLGDMKDFVTENINLAKKVANYYRKKVGPMVDVDDLIQEGAIGLIHAYHNFDPTKGAISTIATIHIKAKILDYLRFKLPILKRPKWIYDIMATITKLGLENEPPEDIAKVLNRSVETVKNALQCYSIITIYADASMDKSDGNTASIMGMFGTDFDESGLLVREFIETLSDVEKKIVVMKVIDMTQTEISKVIGVSQMEVCRRLKKIKRKARFYFGDKL